MNITIQLCFPHAKNQSVRGVVSPKIHLPVRLFFPDWNTMLQLVDHPAAGIESGSTMFRSCSNEDDIVASFDCGDTMHDASIQQAESVESFFTQLAHLGQRHTTVGFEADLGGLHLPPNCTPPSPTTLASCCSQMCGVGHVAMKSRSQSDPIQSRQFDSFPDSPSAINSRRQWCACSGAQASGITL